MKQSICTALATTALAAAALAIGTGTAAAQSRKINPLKPGTKAPEFTLKSWDGTKTYTLSDYRAKGDKAGQIVVVDFWCSQCPGSRRADPALSQITRDYTKKNVQFIAIDANGIATTDQLKQYIAANTLPFPVVKDVNFKTADAFGALVTPHVFVIDQQGVIRYAGAIQTRQAKGHPRHKAYLTDALDALLAGKPVPAQTSRPFG